MTNGLSLRARIASVGVRSVNWLSRVSGRGTGTVAGGRVGLRICPDLLSQLADGRTVILVSGTNGKTTTTAMTAAGWGGEVTTNATGSNMPAGHVAALVESGSRRVVLEVDEAWLPDVVAATNPRVVVLLNLSRDQLDRASEVRQMAERWRRCFASTADGELVVVANANDPLVHEANSWHCSCGFAKPATLTTTLLDGLVVAGSRATLRLSLPGSFNEANAALAATALVEVGVALEDSVVKINALSDVAGRFTFRRWGARSVRLLLAKNPAGFAAILSTIDPGLIDVWIAINARIADGRDPSWLYDVPFETLRGHRIFCLGERRLDLATRLEYANVQYEVIDDEAALSLTGRPVALVANYTAFSDWLARTTPC